VQYNIKVDLDPRSAKMTGSETIIYKNNSPDTLRIIYFHLYYNAFKPGSYLDFHYRESGDYEIAELSARGRGYIDIDLLKIDGSESGDYAIDNTVMKLNLGHPLAPGGEASIYIEWTSQIPARGSRTAHSGRHFDVGQWYPKPAVYDRFGWHAQQYLDYEFFADFADFNVELTLPAEFIVAHMGELINEEEIYGFRLPEPPGDTILVDILKDFNLRGRESRGSGSPDFVPRDREDEEESEEENYENGFNDDSPDSAPDTVTADTELRTWKFRADNVHDFAFCADPEFIVDICKYKDVEIRTYYKESNREYWQTKAAEYTRKAIRYFSEKYMPYPCRQYSTVSGLTGGGMEYPQLTMVWQRAGSRGDHDHGLESLIVHEVGHAWFYGILGFNENEQAFLDEGLTSFAEIDYMEHYYGRRHNNYSYKKGWQKKLLPNGDSRNDAQKRYIGRAMKSDEDPMLIPADLYKSYGHYYNASYEKAASVYFMLQYAMGREKFGLFLSRLFEKWAYRHPYFEDVKRVAEEVHGSSLEWFFRQWFQTTWRLDYSLNSVQSEKTTVGGKSGYNVTFSISRKERCISPLDMVLYYNKDISDTIYISEKVWDSGRAEYDTTVFLRGRPGRTVIDPDRRLADINMLNNSTGFAPVNWQFMVPLILYKDNYIEYYVDSYTVAHRPLLWYNSVDGVKTGYRFDGSYLGIKNNLALESWIGLNNGKADYRARYGSPVFQLNPNLEFYLKSMKLEGRGKRESGFNYAGRNYDAGLSVNRYYVFNSEYIRGPYWSRGDISTLEAGYDRRNEYRITRIHYGGSAAASIWGSDYRFSRAFADFEFELLDIFGNNTRLKIITGISNGNVPAERKFYLSSADPLEIWNSPLYRSRGTLPDSWKDQNRLFKPGGGGLSGYYDQDLRGDRIFTARLERDFPPIRLPVRIPFVGSQLGRVRWKIYAGSGMVWDRTDEFRASNFLSEAGFAFSYRIPYLDYLISESVIRLYLPVWLSEPRGDDHQFEWRWIAAITE
jgi:aminopeptidase N